MIKGCRKQAFQRPICKSPDFLDCFRRYSLLSMIIVANIRYFLSAVFSVGILSIPQNFSSRRREMLEFRQFLSQAVIEREENEGAFR